jgi:hypothetical protein
MDTYRLFIYRDDGQLVGSNIRRNEKPRPEGPGLRRSSTWVQLLKAKRSAAVN